VATPERLAPSRRLRSAAAAERRRLQRRLERVERQAMVLRSDLESAEGEAVELRRQLALLDGLALGEDGHRVNALRVVQRDEDAPLGVLRGADIRIAAVRILAAGERPDAAVHYGEWYELVRSAGYGIAGRDPLATFLTQITRSPVVQHAGGPGLYALDREAPQRLHERLSALHEELAQLRVGQQTLEDIATVRERRLDLTAEYDRVEQALSEAVEALGLATAGSA
jgi:hypothetical protein